MLLRELWATLQALWEFVLALFCPLDDADDGSSDSGFTWPLPR